MNTEAVTLSTSIHCAADKVYEFILNAENMPRWAFCKSMRKVGKNEWMMGTADGEFPVRFVTRNEFRVADHYVTIAPGNIVYSPMRVLDNGQGGCVVTFTLFRLPTMSDADFARDRGMVEKDLAKLKELMET
ncbi:MAG TPA: SRPBCC family protein [Verrucomicrobiae bacterium]